MKRKIKWIILPVFLCVIICSVAVLINNACSIKSNIKKSSYEYKEYWKIASIHKDDENKTIYIAFNFIDNQRYKECQEDYIDSIKYSYDKVLSEIYEYKNGRYCDYTITVEYGLINGSEYFTVTKNNSNDNYVDIFSNLRDGFTIPAKKITMWFPKVNRLHIAYCYDMCDDPSFISEFNDIKYFIWSGNITEEEKQNLESLFPNCYFEFYNVVESE